jgi:hypothetical protein
MNRLFSNSSFPTCRRQSHFNLKFETCNLRFEIQASLPLRVTLSPHQFLSLPISVSPYLPIFVLVPSPDGQTVLHVLQT